MMKKSAVIITLAAVLMMTACTTQKGLPNPKDDTGGTVVDSSMQVEDSAQVDGSASGATCDIETVFDDPVFVQIMEGEIVPVEVRHGLGGEGGYSQDVSQDPEVIKAYIEAFRNMKIKEILTDKDDFNYVSDGINDYIFYLEDGSEVMVSMDLSMYVIKDGKQYVFEYSQELHDLNEQISSY